AVPARTRRRVADTAFVGGVPVALVRRVRIAAVAVTRGRGTADEVVAADHLAGQVAVGGDAGVDHRHLDAGAGGDVPRGRHVDAAGRVGQVPLAAVIRVVRRQDRAHDAVRLDVFDG